MKLDKQVQGEIWQIVKMLQEGEVLTNEKGVHLKCHVEMEYPFVFVICGKVVGTHIDWRQPLYHKLKTYKVGVNQVELDDYRIKSVAEANEYQELYFCHCIDRWALINVSSASASHLTKLIFKNLLHTTKQAAIEHTEAMLEVSNESETMARTRRRSS